LERVFLGLGSNLGDRLKNLEKAANRIDVQCGGIVKRSSVYETDPVDFVEQPAFLNQVLEIETNLSPADLMKECLLIERETGRIRGVPKGPRIIDIDILVYGQHQIEISEPVHVIVPHPRMHLRRFVLEPLAEIAGDLILPSKDTVRDLLRNLTDNSKVTRL
jgi:2-amino-4-hydroxy-6-hydroxymethyldihydropteridine diphosphokinase